MKKILIVEDELLIAEDIKTSVETLGYQVIAVAMRVATAIEVLKTQTVDLILLDITLKGAENGIDLAQQINAVYKIPFIFLTSHSDAKTVEQAIKTSPAGYIVKPFSKPDLYTSIALAFEEENNEKSTPLAFSENTEKDHLFLKVAGLFCKVYYADILYFKAAGNYIEVHQTDKTVLVRETFKELSLLIPSNKFIQVHKSYIFNKVKITAFNSKHLYIDEQEFLVGRSFAKSFMNELSS